MSDLLRIATTGLITYQGALSTTGHNITNANVEGYSRQRLETATQPAQILNGAWFGNGVDITNVTRIVDSFLISQMRTDTWVFNQADTQNFYNKQIDDVLNDPSVGLSDRIDSFFKTLQDGANDPVWLPNRQVALSEAHTLADRFNSMYARLAELNDSLNTRLNSLATDISTLASKIADLNVKIGTGVTNAQPNNLPNDLLDERDRLIQQLSEIVDVQAVPDGNSINLFLGKGQALVVGNVAYKAITVSDRFDPTKLQLAIANPSGPRVVSYEATGGKIGGLLKFRDQVLDPTFNQIGRIALAIGDGVNQQNRLGMDLEGDLGGLVFNDINDPLTASLRARAASDNDPTSTGAIRVLIDDPDQLTTSSYQLNIGAGGSWQLIRNSDKVLVGSGAGPLTDTLVSVDGFTLDLNLTQIPPGVFNAGDSYLIDPTRRGAQSFEAIMTRPEELAFAQPIRTNAVVGNAGTGTIEPGTTFDTSTPIFATPATLSPPLRIHFTSTTTFDILNANTSAVLVGGVTYVPGTTNTLFSTVSTDPDYFGFQVTISGDPAAGDSFRVGYNTGGVSDNRNALAMAKLQTTATMENGSATYQAAYGELVGSVGTETRQSKIDSESGQALLNQTTEARNQFSGVNLDEEAANLIRFQQAYNASAQVIGVARTVIQALFDALR